MTYDDYLTCKRCGIWSRKVKNRELHGKIIHLCEWCFGEYESFCAANVTAFVESGHKAVSCATYDRNLSNDPMAPRNQSA